MITFLKQNFSKPERKLELNISKFFVVRKPTGINDPVAISHEMMDNAIEKMLGIDFKIQQTLVNPKISRVYDLTTMNYKCLGEFSKIWRNFSSDEIVVTRSQCDEKL